jgi:hypothetical protein
VLDRVVFKVITSHSVITTTSDSVSNESSSGDKILIAFSDFKETCVGQSGFYGYNFT